MTDIRTANKDSRDPGTDTPPPGNTRRTARQLMRDLDGPGDDRFKESLADLSSQLGRRAAEQSTADPKAAAEARRAALQAYDLARERRLKTALRTAAAAVAVVAIASLTVFIALPADRLPPRAAASVVRPSPAEVVAVAPTPASPPPAAEAAPVSAAEAAPVPAPIPAVEAAPVPAGQPAPAPARLQRDEVKEIQARLRAFGFNPGPPDGSAGPMTRSAIVRYQQSRQQPQTGAADRALLEQLRRDPALPVAEPQVAQGTQQPGPSRPSGSTGTRPSDPFEPLRAAARDVERWFQSIGR